MAEMSSLPTSIVDDAKNIVVSIDQMQERIRTLNGRKIKIHATFTLATRLIQLAKNSRMDDESLRSYLKHLKKNYEGEIKRANGVQANDSENASSYSLIH